MWRLRGSVTVLALVSFGLLWLPATRLAAKGGEPFPPVVRLAGGDLPHPVTLALDDVMNRLPGSAGITVLSSPPDVATVAPYQLSFGSDQYQYYPRLAAIGVAFCGTCEPSRQWVELDSGLDRLLRRYLALARANRIGESPSWAEVLLASAQRWPLTVHADSADLNERDAAEFLQTLTQASPVVIGVREPATNDAARRIVLKPVTVQFGDADELSFSLVPAGTLTDSPLLFVGPNGYSYYASLTPPALVRNAYQGSTELASLLSSLGMTGTPSGLEVRVVSLPNIATAAQVQVRDVAITTDSGQLMVDLSDRALTLDDLFQYLAPDEAATLTADGQPWSLQIDVDVQFNPYPEAFGPVAALYYPDEGYLYLPNGVPEGNGGLSPSWAKVLPALQDALDNVLAAPTSEQGILSASGSRR